MTAEDDVEGLYGVPPEEFLARRKDLVAAARKRGDAEAAKLIGAARRPTTAAWVVNALVRADGAARRRLAELADGLRAAHAAMDGARIRELSSVQRKLIDELARTGFTATAQSNPSAALRDDVVGTLQAAIADPDVAARLGRLEKAERWSGFGDFGSVTTVGPVSKSKQKPKPKAEQPDVSNDHEAAAADVAAARERVASARIASEAARQAHSDAVDIASERKAELARARRHYEKLLESVDAAERALNAADEQFEAAERASHDAADRFDVATSAVALADSALAALLQGQSQTRHRG
ncbi:MAG TPA: hypothetical protein VET27_08595 [Mycobacterium sp.]|nr:hypothetical protein [Mycobacterium sp.]